MSKEYSAYQRGVIKRFYENRDTLAIQKLAEIVSNLYLETNEGKIKRGWKSAKTQMLAAGVNAKKAEEIFEERDLGALAKIVQTKS